MSLRASGLPDTQLGVIGKMNNMVLLKLDENPVTDAGLARLTGLQSLRAISLSGTQVTDAGLLALSRLPHLQQLYAWNTGVKPTAVKRLLAAKQPPTPIWAAWIWHKSQLSRPLALPIPMRCRLFTVRLISPHQLVIVARPTFVLTLLPKKFPVCWRMARLIPTSLSTAQFPAHFCASALAIPVAPVELTM